MCREYEPSNFTLEDFVTIPPRVSMNQLLGKYSKPSLSGWFEFFG
jgi:hypothetical protein